MMFLSNRLRGVGKSAIKVQHLGNAASTSSLTTYSFGPFTVPEDGLLVVVFAAHGGTQQTVNSSQIGGVAADGLITSGSAGFQKTAIAHREVSAGSVSVSFTLSGANGPSSNIICSAYLLTKYKDSSPFGTGTPAPSTSASKDVVLNLPKGGAAFFSTSVNDNNDIGWSSAVEEYEVLVNKRRCETAKIFPTTEATPHTETITFGGGSDTNSAVGASWR